MTSRLELLAVGMTLSVVVGCQTERIEYHKRPSFYRDAIQGELPDRVVLEDGTVIVYTDSLASEPSYGDSVGVGGTPGEGQEAAPFEPVAEDEDGNYTLRAILPEHVVNITLWCIRSEQYELLWEQLVSDRTKGEYNVNGEGVEEFVAYCEENRRELARTLNRMTVGWSRGDVRVDRLENEVFRCQLRKRVGSNFKYTSVYAVVEGWGMKLLIVR